MPVKRRAAKRKADAAAAWAGFFETGYDFFGELEPFGIEDDQTARSLARDAWAQFGAAFLRQWEPTPVRELPWAYEAFGDPATCR
jgi:hypothetical protein